DGVPTRAVVEAGISALGKLWHRGAVDADGKTGDGAGIHVQIPQAFFKDHIERTGHTPLDGLLAVGMVFLSRTDLEAQEACRCVVEGEIIKFGYTIYGWRQVPVDIGVVGEKANLTRPEIEQVMIANTKGTDEDQFEKDLYVIRRRIEKKVLDEHITDFYICSLSCRSVIYKGMFLAEQLTTFYPDLLDERFTSNFAIYHQRYSTNTFPTWRLAQPFRMLAHNGEINTVTGNINWMKCHEAVMSSPAFEEQIEDLKPVVQVGSSDSAAMDATFELLARAGRIAPAVKALMVPESTGQNATMPPEHTAMFNYCNSVMEPWDGPAAVCATDGRWLVAGLDRNGLRPMRYSLTKSGLLSIGSETGLLEVKDSKIIEKGRIGPGGMVGIDLKEGKFYRDGEMKDYLANGNDFKGWVDSVTKIDSLIKEGGDESAILNEADLHQRQSCFALTREDMDLILRPMAEGGKEAMGSMGDDTPLAVLSDRYRGLHHFFRQTFSQVTNPPIDSLREARVMSLRTRLGNLGNILDESKEQLNLLQLNSPVLTNAEFGAMREYMGKTAVEVDCTFDTTSENLAQALSRICQAADDGVRGGCKHVVLTDEAMNVTRAAIPMILATAAVHSHLISQSLRTFTSLNVRSAECLDVHYFAVLIGVGATSVNAYLAQEAIAYHHSKGLYGGLSLKTCVSNYKKAVEQGLLKIMSKMGIGVISSYRGGACFEAIGLSRTLVATYFPTMTSRISGIGLSGIESKVREVHRFGFDEENPVLPIGGFYNFRASGERHAFQGPLIHKLQKAVETGSYALYRQYAKGINEGDPIQLRDLLSFNSLTKPISTDDVESITEIRKRFITPAMSQGALSPEAHETLAIAMNRIGAKSNSGEGGEDSERFTPRPNGDNASSAIKQVASGRFGVTAEYLNNCREIQIKVAQGAKPGEGGQLPGYKVSLEIAKLRYSTPGVTLISPPPHHDIYSIEDLAQLIYDLKQINPTAKVCVKLVARSGVGTIAAGVAKANADVILISGYDGGTGASPLTSIKYAGLPWEMGLSEVNQVLTLNKLRNRVTLRVDGGIKTGRDVVIAAMLGGEEFGVGTTSLIAMGCIMVRQCHTNTCPVGVCTQDPALRDKFRGTPAKVVNLFTFIAEEVAEILAGLGAKSLNEVIGRTDLLAQVSRGAPHLDDLDMNPLLAQGDPGDMARICTQVGRNPVPDTLDARMIADAQPTLELGEKMQLTYTVRNTHRAVGTRLSAMITRKYGMDGLAPGHLHVKLRGSGGQSLGAFAVQGLTLEVSGDSNDYVGKGLSGGTIIVRPPTSTLAIRNTEENTIIGNTVLYGATAGKLFAAGQAGERFAVRNSGVKTVIEGCGSNGCEYMTNGIVVSLGAVGANFAAGMTGGMAFVYDAQGELPSRINPESVIYQQVETSHWDQVLRSLVEEHAAVTKSPFAARLLNNWTKELPKFWQVIPKEMLDKLEHPVTTQKAIA
ncbi:MAG: glutamate synthase large subunit, partial [Rhodospirillales bacterium]|nr:glutamate synthase large subunit [Rhodospirillales bacterium]